MWHTNYLQFRYWNGKNMLYSGKMCSPDFKDWWENWSQSHIEDDAEPLEIMQVTELVDKNEKAIYFGDIVEFSFHDKESGEEYGGTALVVPTIGGGAGIRYEWSEYIEELVAIDQHGGQQEGIWNDDELWTIEVIGNKYRNPFLLMDCGAGLPTFKD